MPIKKQAHPAGVSCGRIGVDIETGSGAVVTRLYYAIVLCNQSIIQKCRASVMLRVEGWL
jgi:hypothetical protein